MANMATSLQQLQRHRVLLPYALNPARCSENQKPWQYGAIMKVGKVACKMSMSTSSFDKCTYLQVVIIKILREAKSKDKYLTTEPRIKIDVTDSK